MDNVKVIEVKQGILEENERIADEVRREMKEKNIFFLNLMVSPGAGKTTTLLKLISDLKDEFTIGVIEVDNDSAVDAEKMAAAGVRTVQLHTGTMCHTDAVMARRGIEELGTDGLDIIVLENIGNLVCPAEFDIGSVKRAVILSAPEGHDKPLKYPLMFEVSDAMIVNKTDVSEVFDFDLAQAEKNARMRNPEIQVFPVSGKAGPGFEALEAWLRKAVAEWRGEGEA